MRLTISSVKKILACALTLAAIIPLCSCAAPIGSAPSSAGTPIIVSLATPNTPTPSKTREVYDLVDRFYIFADLDPIAPMSVSGTLYINYINDSDDPVYALTLEICPQINIDDLLTDGIASNYVIDGEANELSVPLSVELQKGDAVSLFIRYSARNISSLSDALPRLKNSPDKLFKHLAEITVPSAYSVTSSLGNANVSNTNDNKTVYSFSAESKTDFSISLTPKQG